MNHHPYPPYTEADEGELANGLPCYYAGCKYKGTSWSKILGHVKTRHGVRHAFLNGTYLHSEASKEINAKQNAAYAAKAKANASSKHEAAAQASAMRGRSARATPYGCALPESQFLWHPFACWVKCGMSGRPLQPLEYGGLIVESLDALDAQAPSTQASAEGNLRDDESAPPELATGQSMTARAAAAPTQQLTPKKENEDAPKRNKKYQYISPEKIALYEEYTEHRDVSIDGARVKVSRAAHDWMRDELKKWQRAHSKNADELPYGNEWYYDKRVEAIQTNLLTKKHHKDVVRSYLKSRARALKPQPHLNHVWTNPPEVD